MPTVTMESIFNADEAKFYLMGRLLSPVNNGVAFIGFPPSWPSTLGRLIRSNFSDETAPVLKRWLNRENREYIRMLFGAEVAQVKARYGEFYEYVRGARNDVARTMLVRRYTTRIRALEDHFRPLFRELLECAFQGTASEHIDRLIDAAFLRPSIDDPFQHALAAARPLVVTPPAAPSQVADYGADGVTTLHGFELSVRFFHVWRLPIVGPRADIEELDWKLVQSGLGSVEITNDRYQPDAEGAYRISPSHQDEATLRGIRLIVEDERQFTPRVCEKETFITFWNGAAPPPIADGTTRVFFQDCPKLANLDTLPASVTRLSLLRCPRLSDANLVHFARKAGETEWHAAA